MGEEIVRFIDANIFLESILRNPRWEEAEAFLGKISRGTIRGITSDYVVYSVLLRMASVKKDADMMKDFVISLGNMAGLTVVRSTAPILLTTISLMSANGLDFDDSLQVAFMASMGVREIVSFDKHFSKVNDIRRVEPRDIVG